MGNLKKESGITLIALVVTIIVLLILAGVSVNMLTGENGILKRAQEAKEKTELASKKEEAQINVLEQIIENEGETIKTADKVIDNLKNDIGSYVEYNVDLNNDNDYTNDWKLFYAGNESGKNRLFLIAADYVPTNDENLTKSMLLAKMHKCENEEFSSLSAHWEDTAPEYQEVEKDEFLKLFMYKESTDKEKNNVKCVSTLLNPENWQSFKTDEAEYVIGGPTLEMWIAAWNATNPVDDDFVELDSQLQEPFGYYYGAKNSQLFYDHLNMDGIELRFSPGYVMSDLKLEILRNKYSTFFPHTQKNNIVANGVNGNCCGYLITSPRAKNEKTPLVIAYDGSIAYVNYDEKMVGYGIRPLVCLSLDTKLNIKDVSENGNKVYSIIK